MRETEDLQLEHPQLGDTRPAGIFIGAGSVGVASPRRATQWGEDFADRDEFGLNTAELLDGEIFYTLLEAQVLIERWTHDGVRVRQRLLYHRNRYRNRGQVTAGRPEPRILRKTSD